MGAKKPKVSGKTIAIIAVVAITGLLAWYLLSPQAATNVAEDGSDKSHFSAYSYTDGEVVSSFLEGSIWTPKDDVTFDDDEDWYKKANFEEKITSTDIDDIEIDLTDYEKVWLEVDPDGESVFASSWHLIYGGSNSNFTIPAFHIASDVPIACIDNDAGGAFDFTSDGNYTLYGNFPTYTTTNAHYGENWAMDDDDFDDLDSEDQEDYYDENQWRCQPAYYDIDVDTSNEYDSRWEMLTSIFAIKLQFNTTVSTTNGATTQVNLTVSEDAYAETLVSGAYIYIAFYRTLTAPFSVDFELSMNTHINASAIYTGRANVPGSLSTLTGFSANSISLTA